jgi:hypothetical protein
MGEVERRKGDISSRRSSAPFLPAITPGVNSLFARLISHQPIVLFSPNKSATSNQPAVLFSQNKSAPAISHQPTEQAEKRGDRQTGLKRGKTKYYAGMQVG